MKDRLSPCRLDVYFQAQGRDHPDHGGKTGVTVRRKRPVEAFVGKTSFFGHLGHVLGPSYVAQHCREKSRITLLESCFKDDYCVMIAWGADNSAVC